MNNVVITQAKLLTDSTKLGADDTTLHLFLEQMLIPVDIQDKILHAVATCGSIEPLLVETAIDNSMDSTLPDWLWH